MDGYSSIEKDASTAAVLNKYDDEVDGDKPDEACQIIYRRLPLPVSYYLGHANLSTWIEKKHLLKTCSTNTLMKSMETITQSLGQGVPQKST